METEIIEEKKALIDESIEEVSGGRYLSSKELKTLSPETKEKLMKSATRLDSLRIFMRCSAMRHPLYI